MSLFFYRYGTGWIVLNGEWNSWLVVRASGLGDWCYEITLSTVQLSTHHSYSSLSTRYCIRI